MGAVFGISSEEKWLLNGSVTEHVTKYTKMEVFYFFLNNCRMNQLKDGHDKIDFQTEYLVDIAKDANYGYDLDTAQQFHDREHHKHEDWLTEIEATLASLLEPSPQFTTLHLWKPSMTRWRLFWTTNSEILLAGNK